MKFKDIDQYLQSYLQLESHCVGVKLYENKEEFEQLTIKQNKHKSFYCHMVKKASEGKLRKATLSNFACETSGKILGLDEFYQDEEGIKGWYDSGLYENQDLAKIEHESVEPIRESTVGLTVGPLSHLSHNPDVLIIACNPYQAMRIIQGYTYHYGFKSDFKMSGMCGVCFESTSLPINKQELTVSLLCSGTRFICKWPDDIMMIAFPYSMAENILNGIIKTAQVCEPNYKKTGIKHKINEMNLKEKIHLIKNKGYFYNNKE